MCNLAYVTNLVYNPVMSTIIYLSKLYTCTVRWLQSVTIHYKQFIIFNYVGEHQLPPVIDASHIAPITRVYQSPELLKLVEETLSMF